MHLVIDEEEDGPSEEKVEQVNQAALADGIPVSDARLVAVFIKIRDARAALAKDYEDKDEALKKQVAIVSAELMRRLNERGATQTKTDAGTAFFGEDMKVTIADEVVFQQFVLSTGDLDFYQKRVKVEHLRKYMKTSEGKLPPGLNVFRERTMNVRAPSKPRGQGISEPEAYEDATAIHPTGAE